LLEKAMLDILQYIPIHDGMPDENWKVSSPKLIDIFVKSCFLFEAAFKGISNEPTDRIVNYLKQNAYVWSEYFLDGKNRNGKCKELDICDFLTFYDAYCSLNFLEARIRCSQNISDVWVNKMTVIRPFFNMKLENNVVIKSPDWWKKYTQIKHNFYSYPQEINLEATIEALAALISFTAVVPQMRRLLCDHGYIQDNFKKPFDIEKIGRKINDKFVKDPWVNHKKMFFEEYDDIDTMPAIACVSDLFIVPFVGDYRKARLWSGIGK